MRGNVLIGAIKDNDIEIIQLVSKREGFNIENKIGKIEYTALQVACLYGSFEIIKFLIEEFKCNIKEEHNLLHILCSRENLPNEDIIEIFEYLFSFALSPFNLDNNGNTCLHILCKKHGNKDVSKYLDFFLKNFEHISELENKDKHIAFTILVRTYFNFNINNLKSLIKDSGVKETLLLLYSNYLDLSFIQELYDCYNINIMEAYTGNLIKDYVDIDILKYISEKDDNFPDFIKKNIEDLRRVLNEEEISWIETFI